MLDEGALAWLTEIENAKREADGLAPRLKDEMRRNSRLKSAKARTESNALLAELDQKTGELRRRVETETESFFKEVFGISKAQPCAKKDATGVITAAICAGDMNARLLSDGTGVFTITGTSLETDLHPGLPSCEYLMAQQKLGETLVPL